jgi:2-isopropylmalate synthase
MIKNCGDSYDFSSNLRYTEMHRIIKQINRIAENANNDNAAVTLTDADETSIHLDVKDTQEDIAVAVKKLGYDLSEEDEAKVYEEFVRVAEKKNVGAKELDAIIATVAHQVPPTYRVQSYIINSGNLISSTANIVLEKGSRTLKAVGMGDGPIDASLRTIEQIIGHHYELDDYQVQSVTEGKEALGSALVRLRVGGKLYSGNGTSTDIIAASIRAYINALNKIVFEEA